MNEIKELTSDNSGNLQNNNSSTSNQKLTTKFRHGIIFGLASSGMSIFSSFMFLVSFSIILKQSMNIIDDKMNEFGSLWSILQTYKTIIYIFIFIRILVQVVLIILMVITLKKQTYKYKVLIAVLLIITSGLLGIIGGILILIADTNSQTNKTVGEANESQ
ncbi:hypothetical protein [Mycoplasma putrefaciens]|uniref:Transmembrane protein n=1 Tax=Mycoplasma putrefaciens Mput9231 TaxID=1292033 RepID=M9WHN1_9MOLU|nr:hypothetical protein [Mycoplasma putrefaciens]AGJ90884.1 Hypothetical protein, predicted transmembrane protein [Mycoplasma putrefaciens Mput9231]